MKLGYACQHIGTGLTTNKNIRLSAFTEKKFIETVARNLSNLACIIGWNQVHDLLFFRIGSQVVPFASHPVCCVDWHSVFRDELREIGNLIKQRQMRISMHADQFVVLNSSDPNVVNRSIGELRYLCEFMDLLGLDRDSRVQLHIGGVYGNKQAALKRFIKVYKSLPAFIRQRLAIENDDRLFSVADCLRLHDETGLPVILDVLHHQCRNDGESLVEVMQSCSQTWSHRDGTPIVEYSEQEPGERKGVHSKKPDENNFLTFFESIARFDFDLMLELRDREASALRARELIRTISRHKIAWIKDGIAG